MIQTKRPIRWLHSMPFFLVHLAALSVFFVPFSWKWVALLAATYLIRMFGITAGYHRYFSHRSYKANRFVQFLIAWVGGMSAQKGALWWAANHRHHHKFSDTPQDIHSPLQDGFWWSHVGWILSDQHDQTHWDLIADLKKFPELCWLNTFHLVPPVVLGASIYLIFGFPGFAWGFLLSTVLVWHGTFTINSLSHVFGSRRYETGDTSRNNLFLALITLGEGWHNNHHAYMSCTRQGFYWWEIDLGYYALKILSVLRVVSDLRHPPLERLESRRIQRRAFSPELAMHTDEFPGLHARNLPTVIQLQEPA